MQNMNKRVILLISLCLCLLLDTRSSLHSAEIAQFPHRLSGSILIAINDGSDCHDFTLSLPDNTLAKVHDGKIVIEKKNGRSYKVCRGSTFLDNWKQERGAQTLKEDEFKAILGEYNLADLDSKIAHRDRNNCEPAKSFQLQRRSYSAAENSHKVHINEQKSHAVYTSYSGGPGLLIDLDKKRASNIFCNDRLGNVMWDKTGRYVAYTTADYVRDFGSLIIADINNNKRVLEKRSILRFQV